MLTLSLMRSIELRPIPWGQIATASLFLTPNYYLPPRRTEIVVEGVERIPHIGKVFLALNHTDRYNYWPLQYALWRRRPTMYTSTWVKGKYYNSSFVARLLRATNNIPTPSRGYILATDATSLLGRPPSNAAYRIVRDELDRPRRDLDRVRASARREGVGPEIERLLGEPRSILDHRFDPKVESYFEAIDALFSAFMDAFLALNGQAFALGQKVIVFPEGTRSLRLHKGRTGLAQVALRTGATIVPIGCNGSDKLYPTNSPLSRGGRVVYRVGEPLTPCGALAPFRIMEPYTPFTKQAERSYDGAFRGATDLVMSRIAELLDPEYLPSAGETTEVQGVSRFM